MGYSTLHLGQFQTAVSEALSEEMGRRVAARAAARSEAWRAQLWMQMRWKTAKQREVHDQVGSESLMRSRHIRHDRAPEEEDVRKERILERSVAVAEAEEWPEKLK